MVIQENSATSQGLIAIECPFCSAGIGRIYEATVQKIKCQECNNSFHFPELTDTEKMVVALASINESLRGVSKTIWTVFFWIPVFVGFCWGFMVAIYFP